MDGNPVRSTRLLHVFISTSITVKIGAQASKKKKKIWPDDGSLENQTPETDFFRHSTMSFTVMRAKKKKKIPPTAATLEDVTTSKSSAAGKERGRKLSLKAFTAAT